MKVVICEDDALHLEMIHSAIINYAMFERPSIEVVLWTQNPTDVLAYMKEYKADCYFLDIEFEQELTGIDLAKEIREKDPLANIIFVTTHAEQLKLTFTYKLAALDYIVKVQGQAFQEQLIHALEAAFIKYEKIGIIENVPMFQVKMGERIKNISFDDIYFFITAPQAHKIELHCKQGNFEFYGKVKELPSQLDERFYRCHQSCIVNVQHIEELDQRNRTVIIVNREECPVSYRAMKQLKRKMEQWKS